MLSSLSNIGFNLLIIIGILTIIKTTKQQYQNQSITLR